MAGLTHTAFRRLVRELGAGGLLTTEMLSARSLPREDRAHSPYLRRTPSERPLSYQLLVADPAEVAPALDVLHAEGADACDLNMGCPAPQARRRGGGSRLMERPDVARAIVAEARRRTGLPLTAKIRLGERLEEAPLREFCCMLEAEGIDLVTVHARLRGEPYGRRPRWDWAGKVKQWLRVPVVANGGVFDETDAQRCLAASSCDGIMVGRGAAVRPWFLADVAAALRGETPAAPPALPAVYQRFAVLLGESFAPERRLGRLKEFTRYFAQSYAFGHTLTSAIQASRSLGEALDRAQAFFAAEEGSGAPWIAGDRAVAAASPGSPDP
ncbi:MAG: tRNA-dihydrouridine synthase family protein [Deltaproteobacteria bacterium]|nr:tRNA-dihydrouridine synthase family protein [Deltaproteobacteria bacterium]